MKKDNIIKFQKPKQKSISSKKGYALYNEGLCFYRQDKDSIALQKFLQAEKAGYESCDMFSSMARLYGAEGQFAKVKEYAQKAIDIDSEYGYPYFMLGGAYYEDGNYEMTLKNYLLAEEKGYNDDIIMFREMAEVYGKIEGNHFLKQLEYATKAINLDRTNAFSRYWKGLIYFRHYDYSHALKYYLKSEQMGYSDFNLYYEISYCYSMLENPKKAIEYANKCIFVDKEGAMGYYRKGFAYFMQDELEKSEQAFMLAEKRGCREADMYARLAYIYQVRNDYDKAIEYADMAIKTGKKDIDGYTAKGNIYAVLKKDYSAALKYYKKAYKIGADFSEGFYANYAVIYVMSHKYSCAIKLLNKALDNFPNSYELASIKVTALQFQKKYDEAEELIKKLMILDADNVWNAYYSGIMYFNCKKEKKDYEKVIKIFSSIENREVIDYGGCEVILSISYYKMKYYDLSLCFLYSFFRGFCCEEFLMTNYKELYKHYLKLLKIYPEDFRIQYITEKLSSKKR